MDWDQNYVVSPGYISYLSIHFVPCSYYEDNDECVTTEEEQIAYLDPDDWKYYDILLYYNYETFEAEEYGE